MCLLIVLSRVLPEMPLVVVGNRDERFDRPAEPMAVLREDDPRTLGGRDLVAGGTWLAANEWGVVAGLTNRPLEAGADPTKRSRGELPFALTSHPSAEVAVDAFVQHHRPGEYNPAWLLVGDREALFGIDMTGSPTATVSELPPGIHILENRPLDVVSAKVEHVRAQLAGVETLTASDVMERLEAVVADHRIPEGADDTSRDRAPLGAACVHTPEAGTRWSGIVTVPVDRSAPPTFRYTEGPPCQASFLDASPLWSSVR
jgi:uncharacterized protein with NRDE domain